MFKLIIFDMDGTLYDLNDVLKMSYDLQIKFLVAKKKITTEEAVSYLAENHVYPIMKKDSKSATELFLRLGFDKEEWSVFREKRFDVSKIDKRKAVSEKIIQSFTEIAPIVLLSSNAYVVIEKVLSHIEVSLSAFDEIICSDRFPVDKQFEKKHAMVYLSSKYKVEYNEMLSIGDRYSTDIQPMLELGGNGILLKDPKYIGNVLIDLKQGSLTSCESYEFFN